MKNLYLDIDGTLIHDSLKKYNQPANGVSEFLKYITDNYTVYWLTTHCRGGENHAPDYLSTKLPPEAIQYLKLIQPRFWECDKTEAIEYTSDFLWIDDEAYEPELKALRDNNCLDKWIKVDLNKNPNQLLEITKTLKDGSPPSN